MSQRKAKSPSRPRFTIPGIGITDEDGNEIENPTPFHYRSALLALLKATGSEVIQIQVDGHLCAFVMEDPTEVPEHESDTYYGHLIEATKIWTTKLADAFERAKAERVTNAHGGDA